MRADDQRSDRACILDFGRVATRTLVRTSCGSSTESPVNNEPKIMSIAPSFNCMLKCEGCYLTTDVTKEMRDATVDMDYWEKAMTLAVKHGYEELAMTLNPFPGAIEQTIELAKMAKAVGFKSVNVTVTWDEKLDWENQIRELIPHIDVLSESIDENRNTIMDNDFILSNPHVHYNINLLECKLSPQVCNIVHHSWSSSSRMCAASPVMKTPSVAMHTASSTLTLTYF